MTLPRALLTLAASAPIALSAPITAQLEPRAGLVASRVVVDPTGGTAAVVYPSNGAVRLQLGTGAPEVVPTGRAAVVDGVVLANGQVTVLAQERLGCAALFTLVRDPSGVWTRTALGVQGTTATIASEQTGIPTIAARTCTSSVVVSTRANATDWAAFEPVPGVTAAPGARLSLAAAGSTLVLGVSGESATIMRRDIATWLRIALPKALPADESVGTIAVAFDSLTRPVVFIARGPRARTEASITVRNLVKRSVDRLDGGIWTPITTAPHPVGLVGSGYAFGVLDRSGTVTIELTTSGTPASYAIRAARVGIGANGALAQVIAGVKNAVLQLGI